MEATPHEPRSRRDRPAKPALNRSGIVSVAVDLVRSEGLAKVTMRRLAQALDTGPASLYVYFRNTAELHAALLEELLGAVDLSPVQADGDWRERLVQVLASYMDVLFQYPGLAYSAMLARPAGPNCLNVLEAILTLLAAGDVPQSRAGLAIDLLLQFVTATAAEHSGRPHDEGEWDELASAIQNQTADTRPHLAAIGVGLFSPSPTERSSWAFDVLINGILATPTEKE